MYLIGHCWPRSALREVRNRSKHCIKDFCSNDAMHRFPAHLSYQPALNRATVLKERFARDLTPSIISDDLLHEEPRPPRCCALCACLGYPGRKVGRGSWHSLAYLHHPRDVPSSSFETGVLLGESSRQNLCGLTRSSLSPAT